MTHLSAHTGKVSSEWQMGWRCRTKVKSTFYHHIYYISPNIYILPQNIQQLTAKHTTFHCKIYYISLQSILHFSLIQNILQFTTKYTAFYHKICYISPQNILPFTTKYTPRHHKLYYKCNEKYSERSAICAQVISSLTNMHYLNECRYLSPVTMYRTVLHHGSSGNDPAAIITASQSYLQITMRYSIFKGVFEMTYSWLLQSTRMCCLLLLPSFTMPQLFQVT